MNSGEKYASHIWHGIPKYQMNSAHLMIKTELAIMVKEEINNSGKGNAF